MLSILGGMLAPAQARSLAAIKKSNELRVCIVPNHPAHASVEPANCRENCKFTGPVHEATQVFAQSLGKRIRVVYIRAEWDEQFFNHEGKTVRDASYTPELLASEKCDLYPGNLTRNDWRLKKLDFVILFPSRMMVIASKAMQGEIKTASDLAGKTAAIAKDTSYHTWLQEQNQTRFASNPVKFKLLDAQESFTAVDTGTVDFTLADADIAIWLTRHQLKQAKTAFPVGPSDEIGWAFRKEDKDLQATVQKFFNAQRDNETSPINQTWQKHFGISLNKFIGVINSTR